MPLFIHTLSLPLFPGIVQIPTIEFPLRRRRLVGKRIQLVYPANPTRPLFDGIIDLTCLVFVGEIEADEGEIAASQADRRRLTGCCGDRTEGTKRDDGISNPELSWSDWGALALSLFRLRIVGGCWRGRRNVGEDEMVRGEVKVANDLFTTSRQGHIFNLILRISVRDSVLLLFSSPSLSLVWGCEGD